MRAVFLDSKHIPLLRGYNVLVHTDNTLVVSYISHQGGLHLYSLFRHACKLGGRYPVETGAEAWEMMTPLTSSGVHMAEVCQSGSEPVCLQGDDTLSPLVLPQTLQLLWAWMSCYRRGLFL